jgi:anti-sigma-K factor RsiG
LTVRPASAGIQGTPTKGGTLEPLPDLGSLTDDALKKLIEDLEEQEREVSYQRRLLHGKIDILRAELVARLQRSGGKSVLEEVDLDRLSAILAGKSTPPA